MTYRPSPSIERRSAERIFEDVCRALQADERLHWTPPDPPAEALIRAFARYWEVVAVRLNRALDRNFLAYLDLIGVSPLPATSASVPLTFTPIDNAPPGIRIPAGTQVAAAADGDPEPVVFETLRALEPTPASLRHAFSLHPGTNLRQDLSLLADRVASTEVAPAEGIPAEHAILIGDRTVFGLEHIRRLSLRFDIAPRGPESWPRWVVGWSVPTGELEMPLVPLSDGTLGLRKSGEVILQAPAPWPEHVTYGRHSRWLNARLVDARPGNWAPPRANDLALVAEIGRTGLVPDAALADGLDVDLTKDFYPFGARPLFGSTLYVTSADAFAHRGAAVALDVRLTNPHDAVEEPPIPRVNIVGHPRVRWEYWNGVRWEGLDTIDETNAFRRDGVVSFTIPADFARTAVRGQDGAWVRARLVSGNYGEDERWEPPGPGQSAAGMRYRPSTLAPPSIQAVLIGYELTLSKRPDYVLTRDEGVLQDVSPRVAGGASFSFFTFPCGPRTALYLGFDPDPLRSGGANGELPLEVSGRPEAFVNRSLTLYMLGDPVPLPSAGGFPAGPALVLWQIWDGRGWRDLEPADESHAFSRDGTVTFIIPGAAAVRTDFVEPRALYWLRAVFVAGDASHLAALRGILRNTVPAAQQLTLENEVLGSSHATPAQRYRVLRTPVLEGEVLEVRESGTRTERLPRADGTTTAIGRATMGETRSGSLPHTAWIQWNPVADFAESGPDDRHYVIDRERGEIQFGDGRRGRIPPQGSNNVRLRRYGTGGGARGNRGAGKVTQLRTALPYIDSVVNHVPASGGADMERMEQVRERGAVVLRHGGRAVTKEDYEDLARVASPEVGRAECVPMQDLSAAPSRRRRTPGLISLIVVPAGKGARPAARAALLRHVRDYVDRHRDPASQLVVVGPEYVTVSVSMTLVIDNAELGGSIAGQVRTALHDYLHPLYGAGGRGWRLGELPDRSEVYGICASVRGVTYVDDLHLSHREDRAGAVGAGHFLICSGVHSVQLGSPRTSSACAMPNGAGNA